MLVVANLDVGPPAWSPPPQALAELRDSFPQVEFHWNQQRRDYFRRVAEADVIWGWQLTRDIYRLAARLRWFHSCAAGVASSVLPELASSQVVLTNSSSVNAPVVVEHLLGLLLSLFRRLAKLTENQRQHYWGRSEYWDHWEKLRDLCGMTVGVFGYGAIGSRLCSALSALGSRLLVYRRSGEPAEYGAETFTGSGLATMLPQCSLVVNALPATSETRGFFDADKFRLMQRGAVYASIGRGSTTDEAALARALGYNGRTGLWEDEGWLAGAVLDVFAQEPLPADSPLWKAPQVVISPHVAAVSPNFWRRQTALFARNLRHFLNGEALEEVVDPVAGY